MKKVLSFLTSRAFVTFLGVLALAFVIWFIGPLVAIGAREPFVSPVTRLVLIGLIVALWAFLNIRRILVARRASRKIISGLMAPNAAAAPVDQSAEEVAALQQRFEEGMEVLRRSRGKSGSENNLYELPWYIIIGPPGSGKTTALVNSGLEFPLAERFGKNALQGVGGTRDCDWWFTDEAVLLDTAGRYTTQDSHADVDKAAWFGFLDLLKKNRKRRPINGVFVTISLSDLMTLSEQERDAHCAAIKSRINELNEHFGIRFPVYALVTKCDLVAGFMEFFEDLGREERAQVWGFTLPVIEGENPPDLAALFNLEFDGLIERLNQRLFTRIGQERDPRRRALILGFPRQMALLKESLADFALGIFRPSRFEEVQLWRGLYFTSGTQEGTPIDRVIGAVSRNFGLQQQVLPSTGGQGRSYFINHVLSKVAFSEAGIAGTNRRVERTRALLQHGAYVGIIAFTLVALLGWGLSFANNKRYIASVDTHMEEVRQRIADLSPARNRPLDALAALDAARTVPGGYDDRDEGAPFLYGFGLYQGDKIGRGADATYQRLLSEGFLPRVMLDLEGQMQRGGDHPDFLFEALKVYLMLDDPEHFEAARVQAWLEFWWDQDLDRDVTTEQRDALFGHLRALLENMPSPLSVALDENLIDRSRRALLRMPLEERVYGRLKSKATTADLPEFTIADAGGRDAALVFRRKSGQQLNKGIPGLYTYRGFHEFFLPQSDQVANTVAEDSWILGEEAALQQANALAALAGAGGREQLDQDVMELYLSDYTRSYEDLLSDIALVPFSNRDEAVAALRVLSSERRSPLQKLLQGVEQQVTLYREDEADGESLVEKGAGAVEKARKSIEGLLGSTPSRLRMPRLPARQSHAMGFVKRRFGPLQELMGADETGAAPFGDIMALLDELYVFLDSVNSSPDPVAELQARGNEMRGMVGELKREAQRMPPAVAGLIDGLAGQVSSLGTQDIYAFLNDLWRSGPRVFCGEAIDNRYPIQRNGARGEVRRADFEEFFKPGGIMDGFFEDHLKPYVDASRSPWRWRAGSALRGGSAASLAQFEHAKTIRDTFFRGGRFAVGFDLKPLTMDASINQFVLDLEGQQVSYDHGPAVPQLLRWPGPGPGEVRIQMSPPAPGGSGMAESGDWAWFRLLDKTEMTPADRPEHYNVRFRVGDRSALYELKAASAINPFRLNALEDFSCPTRL